MAHLCMTLISDQCHLQCVSNELLPSDKTNKPDYKSEADLLCANEASFCLATEDSSVS